MSVSHLESDASHISKSHISKSHVSKSHVSESSRWGLLRWALLVGALSVPVQHGVAVAEEEFIFEKDVQPILKASCFSCHGASQMKSGLRLDTRERMLQGGESGKVIVPRDADAS